jgi:DNA-binding NtrC family response regulator
MPANRSFGAEDPGLRRVVVLSRDSVIRDLSEVILKSHGFIVDQAETLLDVRSLIATRPVFACVVDSRRTTGRGPELLRQIAEPRTVHLVALVDKWDAGELSGAQAAGASAAVGCPFESQALVAAITDLPPLRCAPETAGRAGS